MNIWERPGERPRGWLKPAYTHIKNKMGDYLTGVEIGIAQGYGTEYVLDGMSLKKFYMIDPYVPYEFNDTPVQDFNKMYNETLNKFKKYANAILIRSKSEEVVSSFKDYSLDFVYIDGNHLYKYTKNDIEMWWPKVKLGGVLSGHDYNPIPEGMNIEDHIDTFQYNGVHCGVIKAVNEFVKDNNLKLQKGELDWWIDK